MFLVVVTINPKIITISLKKFNKVLRPLPRGLVLVPNFDRLSVKLRNDTLSAEEVMTKSLMILSLLTLVSNVFSLLNCNGVSASIDKR